MEDGVRTTQEQLSTHPFGEALNAPKLIKKRSNGLKSTVAAFSFLRFWRDTRNDSCKLALATALFPAFEHTFNC